MTSLQIQVAIADDHPAMLRGIEHELSGISSIKLLGAVGNSTELIALLDQKHCDVLVCDYEMPGGRYGDGITLFSLINRRYPAIKIVVLTMLDSPVVIRTLVSKGISCIVSKSDAADHLLPAIFTVHSGARYFSPTMEKIAQSLDWNRAATSGLLSARESEVVRLLALGMTISEIAERLNRSQKTISAQKLKAMEKLGIENDADLVRYAIENGMVAASQGASNMSPGSR